MKVAIHCLAACWLCIYAAFVSAQSARTPDQRQAIGERAWKGHRHVEQCAWCHYQSDQAFGNRPTDFCRLTEARHWLRYDPHALSRTEIEPLPADDATAQPSNLLSRRIVDKLKYQVDTPAGYQKFVENCLTCHAGYSIASGIPLCSPQVGPPGISCIVCHQTAEQSEWIDLHGSASAATTWRLLSPDKKEAHGMRGLASADAQAKLCTQCHVGDLSQNKFVTHAMYSAGHPPLPSVEHQSLTQAMSPHWRSPPELYEAMTAKPEARDAYFRLNLASISPTQDNREQQTKPDRWTWNTQATTLGGLQTQIQLLTMMEQAASGQYRAAWADYAFYDCAGCHHGLQSPSWRQQHPRDTPPGRPLPVQWSKILEPTIALESPTELTQLRSEYLQALTVVPFGDRQQVSKRAKSYRVALERNRTQLASRALESGFARRAIEQLSQTPAAALLDADSAQQLRASALSVAQDLGLSIDQIPTVDRSNFDAKQFVEQLARWRAAIAE